MQEELKLSNDIEFFYKKDKIDRIAIGYYAEQIDFLIIHRLWPEDIAVDVRSWLGRNVKAALIKQVGGNLVIKMNKDQNFAVQNFKGFAELGDMSVSPDDNLPVIEQVNARLEYTAEQLDMYIHGGKHDDATISKASKVSIFAGDEKTEDGEAVIWLNAAVEIEASLPFVFDVADNYVSEISDNQDLISALNGYGTHVVSLKLPLNTTDTVDDLTMKVDSKLKEMTFALSWFSLHDGVGTVQLTESDMVIRNRFKHGNQTVDMNWQENFDEKKGHRKIIVGGALSAKQMITNLHAPFKNDFSGNYAG